jgi:hypothetical protein
LCACARKWKPVSASVQAAGETENGSSAEGKVYGEFEDLRLFRASLADNPEMGEWSEKEVWDGLSGATIQAKTLRRAVPDRTVLLDGRILAYADVFGQFWISLPPGSYTLVGRCKGYRDCRVTVTVSAGSVQYSNFYLDRR